ncbi:CBS domain-containing protein [Psychromonas sp. RZ22]|uniref:CBS domain-containing protein n=1 Tax=Psychromonas algarum TaxID=2555643 RepID=UPI0010681CBD|nr:CBS domain-containing protein [Psychromonas sp. RZ22]TEW55609.1 CBS domain-containing protein [Psychromonas sp. RZ22]
MTQQTVQQIMRKQPITVQCQTPLNEIIQTLVTSQQSQLPVINSNNKLLGMVSLINCQKALLISGYHCDKPVKVNDIMAKEFTFLTTDEELSEVAIKTQKQSENVFPVVNNGKLIAVMKRVDLLVHLQNNLSLCSRA